MGGERLVGFCDFACGRHCFLQFGGREGTEGCIERKKGLEDRRKRRGETDYLFVLVLGL